MARQHLAGRQALFVHYFVLNGGNASKAALDAGYSNRQHATKLLANDCVQSAIRARQDSLQKRFEIEESRIVQTLAAIAFSNIADVMAPDSEGLVFKRWGELQPHMTAGIKRIKDVKTKHGYSRSIEMVDKIGAIQLLVSYLGFFGCKRESTPVKENLAKDAIERLKQRFRIQ